MLVKDGTRVKSTRGGKRPGAGRPPNNGRPGVPHAPRPVFKPGVPLHIVLRIERGIGNLRQRAIYKAVRSASIVAARATDARIIHISIQQTHIHLLVEADHRVALARLMKSFQISAAKHINRAVTPEGQPRRKGRVFSDRYFAELITNRRQAHRALGYVLNNWRKHREDFHEHAEQWLVDPFSTGILFDGWKERRDIPSWPSTYEPLVVYAPRTWMLRVGWRMYGPLSCFDVPSTPVGAKTR